MGEEIPTFAELEGKYLRGVMPSNNSDDDARLILFFEDYALKLKSHNKDYSWYDNWHIFERLERSEWPERTDKYKTIGMDVEEVWSDGYMLDQHRIDADMGKWINAVGEGSWGAKDGEQYTFIEIRTPIKTVELGTVYWDCHYPSTVWDVIE